VVAAAMPPSSNLNTVNVALDGNLDVGASAPAQAEASKTLDLEVRQAPIIDAPQAQPVIHAELLTCTQASLPNLQVKESIAEVRPCLDLVQACNAAQSLASSSSDSSESHHEQQNRVCNSIHLNLPPTIYVEDGLIEMSRPNSCHALSLHLKDEMVLDSIEASPRKGSKKRKQLLLSQHTTLKKPKSSLPLREMRWFDPPSSLICFMDNLLIWNCKCLGNKATKRHLQDLIVEHHIKIFTILRTIHSSRQGLGGRVANEVRQLQLCS
jgi:hypothetical protein